MVVNVAESLVRFQETGKGFEEVWAGIGPIVRDFARLNLRKLGVRRPSGDDDWAVEDVVGQTVLKLMGLAAPDAKGRFDPKKAKPGLSGVRAWLSPVVKNESVNWNRTFRGGRGGVKILPASGLVLNELPDGEEGSSIVDRKVAKIERPDLLPILEACIDQLPEPFLKEVVRLKLHEEYSERETARALGVSVSRVHRGLQVAYGHLRRMLEDRGMDGGWLAA